MAIGETPRDYMWPVMDGQPQIISGREFQFGHFGIDIRNINNVPGFPSWEPIDYTGEGARVVAARAGVVSHRIVDNGSAGNAFYVAHGGGYFTRYLHLHNQGFRVLNPDTPVFQGEILGRTGRTGSVGGPGHLHFEVIFVEGRNGRTATEDATNFRDRWLGSIDDLTGTETGVDGVNYTYHRRDPMAGYLPPL
jgi:murein DD-endopeptidase MepM/ murein hydrolase activator NlpD